MNNRFKIYTRETAPKAAQELIESVIKKMGFLPNLLGVLAEAPPVAKAFMHLTYVTQELSLTPIEREIVILTISTSNQCAYCQGQHVGLMRRMKIPDQVIQAIESESKLEDGRLEALRVFTMAALERRGRVPIDIQEFFFAAGFSPAQALEVMFLIGTYSITNFSNHLVDVPIDKQFGRSM